jgi:hypothetical protein
VHAGEEIKVAQPRQNKKKKLKGRIYQKLKKAKDDEGEVGDVMDDIAEAQVIQIAQDQNLEIRRLENRWVNAQGEEVEVCVTYTPMLARLLLHAYSCTPTPTLTRLRLHAYS